MVLYHLNCRKNRNSYAKLMLQMLKKGLFEEPFINKPEDGFLPPLTAAQVCSFLIFCFLILMYLFLL